MKYLVETFNVPAATYLVGDIDRKIADLHLSDTQKAVCKICVAYNEMAGTYEVGIFYTLDNVSSIIPVTIPNLAPRVTDYMGPFSSVCNDLLLDLDRLPESEQLLANLTITCDGPNFTGLIYAV
ncbi:MAG: hypothetical protein MI974_18800 [Chitinophagales bacterium]|nr:hypothetical protein [Chitinophagales bacterium]